MNDADDTIVALSSGQPPAAIAIVRVSGPAAIAAASRIAGRLPPPRRAGLRPLRGSDGSLLDRALVLVFARAASATGEDLVEFHCHGGRAVVGAVERVLLDQPGLRRAAAGEFTRRALANGRIDLAQAQGLADLLAAETEAERRRALAAAEGEVSRLIRGWMERLTLLAAEVEASIDFADEDDVERGAASLAAVIAGRDAVAAEIAEVLAAPPVERWRDGWRIVVAGPPNAGKSTLVNLLGQREAAIVSPVAGTTRDRIEVSVQRQGIGYVLVDTAGLRDEGADAIEQVGIARARDAIETADLVLWLGDQPPDRGSALWVGARIDQPGRRETVGKADILVSRDDPPSIRLLWGLIEERLGSHDAHTSIALHDGEREACHDALSRLRTVVVDEVLIADSLAAARRSLATVIGADATSDMLDALFSRFCVGK